MECEKDLFSHQKYINGLLDLFYSIESIKHSINI